MSVAWKHKPIAELIRLSGPICASTLSYSLMTLVDTLLLGRIGRAELAGAALGGLCSFVLLCFSIGLLRGANTLVSQAVGAGRTDDIPGVLGAALATALGLGVVTVIVGQAVASLLPLLSATPAAGAAAAEYLAIRNLAAPVMLVYVALREVRYGRGDARTPMRATVIANLVNIALCYLMVFVFHRGVAGAAVATVIANGVELGILARAQRSDGFGLHRMMSAHLRALWKIGVPAGLQFVLEVGSFAILSVLIARLSEAEMAAHQIAIQVIHFSFLPAWAVGEAAAVLAGQAVGANEDGLVIRIGRMAALLTGIYSGACALVLALAAEPLALAFTGDAAVVAVAIRLLQVAAVFQVFDALNFVARGVLRGTGDVRFAAVVGVSTSWLCTPPLAWLLGWRLGMGAYGGWLGLCLEIIVAAVILAVRVERRGWAPAAAAARARLNHGEDEHVLARHVQGT